MTTPELIIALRELLDDEKQPFLWKDSALVRYLNDSERQACRRAYLLIDKNTASVCQLALSASVASYIYNSKILQFRRVTVGSSDTPLLVKTKEEVDFLENVGGMDWASWTPGIPEIVIVDTKDPEIIFFPPPQSADTAYFEVARLPLNDLVNEDSSSPEIPLLYHEDLLIWGAHRAYMKNDSDSLNLGLAKEYERQEDAKFGALPSARSERLRRAQSMRQKVRPREFGF